MPRDVSVARPKTQESRSGIVVPLRLVNGRSREYRGIVIIQRDLRYHYHCYRACICFRDDTSPILTAEPKVVWKSGPKLRLMTLCRT